jgi:hypothetical protein
VAKRQEMPELPEEVFLEAKAAWLSAIRAEEEDRTDVRALRADLDALKSFQETIENAYNKLPLNARAQIDALENYRIDLKQQVLKAILHRKIDELNFVIERPSGDNQINTAGVNLVGLRAFAHVVKDFWLSVRERGWHESGSGSLRAGGIRGYGPAERFLGHHANRVDPRVTEEDARTVIKRPYSDK